MITLRFVSHPGPFDVACKIAQYWFWPSHCEAILTSGERLGSWFLDGGVKIRPPGYDKNGFSKELIINLPATEEQKSAFFNFLQKQVGKPYDWRAILSFYSVSQDRDWQEDDSWFCSELIAGALAASGLFPQKMAVGFSRITPRDLVLLISAMTIKAETNVR